jgi:hypothetical protein
MQWNEELKQYNNWACWGEMKASEGRKPRKLTFNPHTGKAAKSNDPQTWASYDTAKSFYLANRWRFCGLSFCFSEADPFVGVDLDGCVSDGIVEPWAEDVVRGLGSYAELSPSGHGVHIIARGKIPSSLGDHRADNVEMYQEARFFTVTGKRLDFAPVTINDADKPLNDLYSACYKLRHPNPPKPRQPITETPDLVKVRRALLSIPLPLGYDEWSRICMAVHSAYPNATGLQMVLDWSRGYFHEDNPEQVMESKWQSFDENNSVGIGTLFYYASRYTTAVRSNYSEV